MSDRSRARLFLLRVLVLTALGTLLGRLWVLQVHEGAGYAQAAAANRVREVVLPAVRGEVLDARGRPLIRNRTSLVVTVERSLLRRADADDVLARLGRVVRQRPADLVRKVTPCGSRLPDGAVARSADGCWAGSPYQPVPVASYDVQDDRALARVLVVEERREQFPGVRAQFRPVRDYPRGRLAAHVLGYLGPIAEREVGRPEYAGVSDSALVGRAGVEQTYEPDLRGVDGVQRLAVDKAGTVTGTVSTTPAQAGPRLVLSLDARVQEVAETELRRALERARERRYYRGGGRTRADSGSVVVMEARTGRVLALASVPSYEPAAFTDGISADAYAALLDEDRGSPLLFRATQAAYAPASTFKVLSAAAAVENGQTTFDARTDCPGVFDGTGQTNFEAADLGRMTLRTAIVRSCDTNFYKFSYDAWLRDGGLSPRKDPRDPVLRLAQAFGLGRRTGVDLPGEAPGLVPTRQWRQAYWKSLRDDFCAGAEDARFSAERRARNRDACVDGFRYRAGQHQRRHRPGRAARHPAAARLGVRHDRQRRAARPAHRRARPRRRRRPGAPRVHPARRVARTGVPLDARRPARRAARGHDRAGRHRGGRVRRHPAAGGRQDRHRAGHRQAGHVVVRLLRTRRRSGDRRGGAGQPGRHRRHHRRSAGP